MDLKQPPKVSGYIDEAKNFGSRLERVVEFVSPIKHFQSISRVAASRYHH